jgi:hypothetical protein
VNHYPAQSLSDISPSSALLALEQPASSSNPQVAGAGLGLRWVRKLATVTGLPYWAAMACGLSQLLALRKIAPVQPKWMVQAHTQQK